MPPGFVSEQNREDPSIWKGLKRPGTESHWEDLENQQKRDKKEPSLTDIMKGIENLTMQSEKSEQRLCAIDHAIKSFQVELSNIKENMVTKENFVQLESRVIQLKQKEVGEYSQEIKLLRQ